MLFLGLVWNTAMYRKTKTLSISDITAAPCLKKSKWYQGWISILVIGWMIFSFPKAQGNFRASLRSCLSIINWSYKSSSIALSRALLRSAPTCPAPTVLVVLLIKKKRHQMWTAVTCSWTSGQNCFPFLIRQRVPLKKQWNQGQKIRIRMQLFLDTAWYKMTEKPEFPEEYKMCSKN